MRRYLILLLLLTIPLVCRGDGWFYGGVAAPAGCTKGTTVMEETGESHADGAEWNTANSWTDNASDGIFTAEADNAIDGAMSLLIHNTGATETGKAVQKTFTALSAATQDLANFRIKFKTADATGDMNYFIKICDDSIAQSPNYRLLFNIKSEYLDYFDAGTWRHVVTPSITTLTDNTVYVLTVQMNVDASANQDCVRMWLGPDGGTAEEITYADGTAYDLAMADTVPAGTDRIAFYNSNYANRGNITVDDLLFYEGEYCATGD